MADVELALPRIPYAHGRDDYAVAASSIIALRLGPSPPCAASFLAGVVRYRIVLLLEELRDRWCERGRRREVSSAKAFYSISLEFNGPNTYTKAIRFPPNF